MTEASGLHMPGIKHKAEHKDYDLSCIYDSNDKEGAIFLKAGLFFQVVNSL